MFILLHHQEALLWRLVPAREGASVHENHVANNSCPYLPEVADHQISLLIGRLPGSYLIYGKGPHSLGLSLLHVVTWMNEGVVAHLRGGKGFSCKVRNPIIELVLTSNDETTLLAFQHVIDR